MGWPVGRRALSQYHGEPCDAEHDAEIHGVADQRVRAATVKALLFVDLDMWCGLCEWAFAEGPDDEGDTAEEEEQASQDWLHVSCLRQDLPDVGIQSCQEEVDEDGAEENAGGAFVCSELFGGQCGAFFEQPRIDAGEPKADADLSEIDQRHNHPATRPSQG